MTSPQDPDCARFGFYNTGTATPRPLCIGGGTATALQANLQRHVRARPSVHGPLDDVTPYDLLHRNDFGLKEAPAGQCILYMVSRGLSERELVDEYELLARSGGSDADIGDNGIAEDEGEEEAPASKAASYVVPKLRLGNPVGKLQLPRTHPHVGAWKRINQEPIRSREVPVLEAPPTIACHASKPVPCSRRIMGRSSRHTANAVLKQA
ncbi:MAG: hypothetical protein ACREYC_28325, partial [Gammaproteobacteria bacterium]